MSFRVKMINVKEIVMALLCVPLVFLFFSCDLEKTVDGLVSTKKKECFFSSFNIEPEDFSKPSIVKVFKENWKKNVCECFACPKRFVLILIDKTVNFTPSFAKK